MVGPPDFWIGDGFIMCQTCSESENHESYLELILNDPNHANVLMSVEDLENKGFENMNGIFEKGWHEHQTDDPKQILKDYQEKLPGYDFIFHIDSVGQFDMHFQIFGRLQN